MNNLQDLWLGSIADILWNRPLKGEISMRLAIPTLKKRVAPKTIHAEGVLILDVIEGSVTYREFVGCPIRDTFDLVRVLQAYQVDALICGRATLEQEKAVHFFDTTVIHSAPCSVEDAIRTLQVAHATPTLSRAAA